MIKFAMPLKGSPEEAAFDRCVDRALGIDRDTNRDAKRLHWVMDFAAVNRSCPMDWEALEKADNANFVHDAFGIRRHLDRNDFSPTGGTLLHCFLPRFAKKG